MFVSLFFDFVSDISMSLYLFTIRCFARLGGEIGYGDPNLTAMVSENYEKMSKRRQITCA